MPESRVGDRACRVRATDAGWRGEGIGSVTAKLVEIA